MKPRFFQGKKFPFTPKRRKKSLASQCNNIIDTRHDLAAFRSKLANVSWLRSYKCIASSREDQKTIRTIQGAPGNNKEIIAIIQRTAGNNRIYLENTKK